MSGKDAEKITKRSLTVALLVRALVQVQGAAAIIIENGCVLFAGNENEDYYSN
jgi:hypothetical protein